MTMGVEEEKGQVVLKGLVNLVSQQRRFGYLFR